MQVCPVTDIVRRFRFIEVFLSEVCLGRLIFIQKIIYLTLLCMARTPVNKLNFLLMHFWEQMGADLTDLHSKIQRLQRKYGQ